MLASHWPAAQWGACGLGEVIMLAQRFGLASIKPVRLSPPALNLGLCQQLPEHDAHLWEVPALKERITLDARKLPQLLLFDPSRTEVTSAHIAKPG